MNFFIGDIYFAGNNFYEFPALHIICKIKAIEMGVSHGNAIKTGWPKARQMNIPKLSFTSEIYIPLFGMQYKYSGHHFGIQYKQVQYMNKSNPV